MLTTTDLEAAALARWNGGAFVAQVPGGLVTGRLPENADGTPRAMPYARLACKAVREQWYSEGNGPGAPYVAFFAVTLTLYGIGAKAVGDLLKQIDAVTGAQDWAIAGATPFGVWLQDGSPALDEDPTRRQGEDVWKGTLSYEVAFSAVR